MSSRTVKLLLALLIAVAVIGAFFVGSKRESARDTTAAITPAQTEAVKITSPANDGVVPAPQDPTSKEATDATAPPTSIPGNHAPRPKTHVTPWTTNPMPTLERAYAIAAQIHEEKGSFAEVILAMQDPAYKLAANVREWDGEFAALGPEAVSVYVVGPHELHLAFRMMNGGVGCLFENSGEQVSGELVEDGSCEKTGKPIKASAQESDEALQAQSAPQAPASQIALD